MVSKSGVKLGGHHSSEKSINHPVVAARGLGHVILQTMAGGQHDFNPSAISAEVAMKFKTISFGIDVYIHMPFILNPCSEGRVRAISKASFRKYMNVSHALGARAVILHPGFKKDLEEKAAYQNFLKFFEILKDDDKIKILLETDAGSKNQSAIGSLEFIKSAIRDLKDQRLGMCIDTCHLYARGFSLWNSEVRTAILGEYGDIVQLVHLNVPDPDVELGSNRDRHNSPFSIMVEDSAEMIKDLSTWPMILERRSLSIIEEDTKYVYSVLGVDDRQPSL